RRRARPQGAQEPQGRHLRRAWRRPVVGRVLPPGRARLRVLLAIPRADRSARRGAGSAGQEGRRRGVAFSRERSMSWHTMALGVATMFVLALPMAPAARAQA